MSSLRLFLMDSRPHIDNWGSRFKDDIAANPLRGRIHSRNDPEGGEEWMSFGTWLFAMPGVHEKSWILNRQWPNVLSAVNRRRKSSKLWITIGRVEHLFMTSNRSAKGWKAPKDDFDWRRSSRKIFLMSSSREGSSKQLENSFKRQTRKFKTLQRVQMLIKYYFMSPTLAP